MKKRHTSEPTGFSNGSQKTLKFDKAEPSVASLHVIRILMSQLYRN